MKRKKIINLHGTQELTIEKALNAEMQLGEVAVKNGSIKGESELYVLTDNGETQSIDTFITKDTVEKKISSKQDIISDIETIRQGAAKGATALQSYTEQYKGTVTGVKVNGETKNPSSGVVDLGTVITEHQTLKTINGESILGSGDIVISGNGAYAEVNHGTEDTTFTLTPNTFHVWDEVSSLTLTLGEETPGVANEYLFQFTSGIEDTTLSLPSDLKWANDSAPTIVPNMIYQVSILKGFASVLEFKNTIVFPVIGPNNGSNNEEYAKVYKYFVNTYNLTSTSDSPSNGIIITETLMCDDPNVGGPVIKVSLYSTMLLLWTEKAISELYVPSINNLGEYFKHMWD